MHNPPLPGSRCTCTRCVVERSPPTPSSSSGRWTRRVPRSRMPCRRVLPSRALCAMRLCSFSSAVREQLRHRVARSSHTVRTYIRTPAAGLPVDALLGCSCCSCAAMFAYVVVSAGISIGLSCSQACRTCVVSSGDDELAMATAVAGGGSRVGEQAVLAAAQSLTLECGLAGRSVGSRLVVALVGVSGC